MTLTPVYRLAIIPLVSILKKIKLVASLSSLCTSCTCSWVKNGFTLLSFSLTWLKNLGDMFFL